MLHELTETALYIQEQSCRTHSSLPEHKKMNKHVKHSGILINLLDVVLRCLRRMDDTLGSLSLFSWQDTYQNKTEEYQCTWPSMSFQNPLVITQCQACDEQGSQWIFEFYTFPPNPLTSFLIFSHPPLIFILSSFSIKLLYVHIPLTNQLLYGPSSFANNLLYSVTNTGCHSDLPYRPSLSFS